ncbi:HAD-IIA family hydrolase [Fictibacillus nanhaiensis]|uniref:HAD-IIA family hydrolase n=1 Tax=Fictibacillus nanhaiensis TaxID=742169 RepID=UPI001C952BFC|nr:HAD-IIA family hydrolase [Fictibacillus nanhaiensis]MBY6036669.1 HAD-IIA family hydrolase [Fictibacillus nanhaiensis]
MKQFEGYLFDLDGTIYAGTKLINGAAELVESLKEDGKMIAFLTNNSTLSAERIAVKLQTFGIQATEEQIVCPTDIAGKYLTQLFGRSNVYVIGSEHLTDSVVKEGHILSEDLNTPCDVVLVGRDLNFHYQKLEDAVLHIQRGAKLVATNLDYNHPIDTGEAVPETGALIAAIQRTVQVEPYVIGKPASYLFNEALERFQLNPNETVMVGDNPYTDIKGGRNAGLSTILLMEHLKKVPDDLLVDYTFSNLKELMDAMYMAEEA